MVGEACAGRSVRVSRLRRIFSFAVAAALLAGLAGCSHAHTPRAPTVETVPADKALILTGTQTRVYHFCTCPYAKDIPVREQVGYESPDLAERAGKMPCTYCKPRTAYADYQRSRTDESSSAPGTEAPK